MQRTEWAFRGGAGANASQLTPRRRPAQNRCRMSTPARPRPRPMRLRMALALVALAMRALVPAGFMVSLDPDRWLVVSLCSGAGPMQMALNLDTGEYADGAAPTQENDGEAVDHAPCVFAAAAAPVPPAMFAAIAPPLGGFAHAAPAFPESVSIGRGLAAPPPFATGPPIAL